MPSTRTERILGYIPGGKKKVVYIERAGNGTSGMFPEFWPAILELLDGGEKRRRLLGIRRER